jgi:hypothetical protein
VCRRGKRGRGGGGGVGGGVIYKKAGTSSVTHAGLRMSAEDAIAAVLGIWGDIRKGGCAAQKCKRASNNRESFHHLIL